MIIISDRIENRESKLFLKFVPVHSSICNYSFHLFLCDFFFLDQVFQLNHRYMYIFVKFPFVLLIKTFCPYGNSTFLRFEKTFSKTMFPKLCFITRFCFLSVFSLKLRKILWSASVPFLEHEVQLGWTCYTEDNFDNQHAQ